MCREGADERGEHGSQEGMVSRPELDGLTRRKPILKQAPDVEYSDDNDQQRPANRNENQNVHCKYAPGRCHNQRPASRPASMNTSKVQSFS